MKLGNFAIVIVATLLSLELFSMLFLEFGLIQPFHRPLALWSDNIYHYRTENDPWGAWHKPNSKARQIKSCLDVEYAFNSVGARDEEFPTATKNKSIVVLGDSFAEGYGVSIDDRFDRVIEDKGYDVFNLGAGGDLGFVQYSMIYSNFNDLPHDAVVLFFFPYNDYTDNDLAFWARAHPNSFQERYRPYYKKDGDGFIEQYTLNKPDGSVAFSDFRSDTPTEYVVLALAKYTYTFGTLRFLSEIISGRESANSYSGYANPKPDQIAAAEFYLNKIIADANGRPVIIFSIPLPADFEAITANGVEAKSSNFLRQLSSEHENVYFLDGLELMPRVHPVIEDYYLTCDGHWSPLGHEIAGSILLEKLESVLPK